MIHGEKVGGAYRIDMARPPVNAFDGGFVDAWHEQLDEAQASGCSVLHIRSSQKVFSAGADLKMMQSMFADAGGSKRLVAHVRRMQDLFDRIEALPLVSLAEISGSALGGGLELALACDLRVAADKAVIGLPEARIGLLPGGGGTQRLARLCGTAAAKRIILGGDAVDGKTAAALGIVQWSFPAQEVPSFCEDLVRRMLQASGTALAACKRCMDQAYPPIRAGLDTELSEISQLLDTADTHARIQAFLEGKGGA